MIIKGISHRAKTRIGNHGNIWEDGFLKLGTTKEEAMPYSSKILLRSIKDNYLAWFVLSEIIIIEEHDNVQE